MMTIAQFAERTGLSPSTLRFYEKKALLEPADRLDNGYRLYADDQVPTAQLVNSLREAGVPMAGIRAFLDADAQQRSTLLDRWRRDAVARRMSVEIAARWLEGMDAGAPSIHLVRWDERALLAWRAVSVPPGPLAFATLVEEARHHLRRGGARLLDGPYVRTLDLVQGRLHGEVGFRIAPRRSLPADLRVEEAPPRVFASLECAVHDEKAAHRVFRFVHALDLAPDGLHLERYLPGERDRYQLLVAVRPAGEDRRPPGAVPALLSSSAERYPWPGRSGSRS